MTLRDNTSALAKGLLKVPTLISLPPGPSLSPPPGPGIPL